CPPRDTGSGSCAPALPATGRHARSAAAIWPAAGRAGYRTAWCATAWRNNSRAPPPAATFSASGDYLPAAGRWTGPARNADGRSAPSTQRDSPEGCHRGPDAGESLPSYHVVSTLDEIQRVAQAASDT